MSIADGKLRTLDDRIVGVIDGLSTEGVETARGIFMPFWMRECAYIYRLERQAVEHVDVGGEGG